MDGSTEGSEEGGVEVVALLTVSWTRLRRLFESSTWSRRSSVGLCNDASSVTKRHWRHHGEDGPSGLLALGIEDAGAMQRTAGGVGKVGAQQWFAGVSSLTEVV